MVSRVRKLCIFTVCLILALIVVGCVGQKTENITLTPTPSPQPTVNPSSVNKTPSDYDVEWSVGVSYLKGTPPSPYAELNLKIIARHNFTDMYIVLSDPDGKTIGKKLIQKEDLFDGLEIVKFQMADYKITPKAGNYTVILVSYPSRELLYRETHTFQGANLAIKKVYCTNLIRENTYWRSVKRNIGNNININFINAGDLPAFIKDFTVYIGDGKTTILEWSFRWSETTGLDTAPLEVSPNRGYEIDVPLHDTKLYLGSSYEMKVVMVYDTLEGSIVMEYGYKITATESGISFIKEVREELPPPKW